jgi:PEP-CTERM motif
MLQKLTKLLLLAGMCASTGAQAAISDMSISVHWDTLAFTGPTLTTATIVDENGQTVFSGAEGWTGSGASPLGTDAYALNGASAISSYSDSHLNLLGGYDATVNESLGHAVVTNPGPGAQSGWAGGYRDFIYQAETNGTVTVSVNYSVVGFLNTTSMYDYANGGYEYFTEVVDADSWLATYWSEIGNGSTASAAEAAAGAVATIYTGSFADWQAVEAIGCSNALCETTINQAGVLSMTFDVVAGTHYALGFGTTVSAYTEVAAVPEPEAYAMMLAGLGLVGAMVRRRKNI